MIRETKSINGLNYLKYSPNVPGDYPAVLFLHGNGCRGDDLNLLEKEGVPMYLKNGLEVPFTVYCPQAPAGTNSWYRGLYDKIKVVLDEHSERHITGLSLGGSGTFSFVGYDPAYFKTAGVVCGKPGLSYTFYKGIKMKCWHGDKDTVVPPTSTILACSRLAASGEDVQLTLWLEDGHDIWDRAYDISNPEGYWRWLLYDDSSSINLEEGESITVNGLKITA